MKCKCGKELDCTKPSALVNNEEKVACPCGCKHDVKDYDFSLDWSRVEVNIDRIEESPSIHVCAFCTTEATSIPVQSMIRSCKSDDAVVTAVNVCLQDLLSHVRRGV